MSAKMVAVMNMKGGVGKSATVVSLAEAVAAKGHRVLVIDVDTQATGSYCLVGDDTLSGLIRDGKTVDEYLLNCFERGRPVPLSSVIHEKGTATTFAGEPLPVSLVASSNQLRISERQILLAMTHRGKPLAAIENEIADRLRLEIGALGSRYHLVVFDCAPGVSPFTTAAVGVADMVLVPTIPDRPSAFGLEAFIRSVVAEMPHRGGRSNLPPKVLITRYLPKTFRSMFLGRSVNTHDAEIERIRGLAERSRTEGVRFDLLRTRIRETPTMPHAMSLGGSSPTFSQKYPRDLGVDLQQLAAEVLSLLRLPLENR
jgi:chromosome partitioning protein